MSQKLKLLFLFLSVIDTVNSVDFPFISDIQDLIGVAHDVGDIAAGNVPLKGYFVEVVNPITVIMDTVTQLVDQVTTIGIQITGKLDSILNAVLVRVPLEGKIDNDIKEITNLIARIDQTYDDFEVYAEFPEDFTEPTLRKHIDYVVGKNIGEIQDLLHSMLLIIVPPKSTLQRASLLENIKQLRNISDTLEICDLDLSFQYRLHKIYNILMITELKAFIMTQFAYKQLGELDNLFYSGEMKRAQAKYILRSSQYQIEVRKVMQGAPREVYRCGPTELIEGETYVEFEKLFSIYVINEYQMSKCRSTCGDMGTVTSHKDSFSILENNGYMGSQYKSLWIINKCKGRLNQCEWIGGSVDICENPEGSKKRYQYVKSEHYGNYGEWTACSGATWSETRHFFRNNYACDTCMCICSEEEAESTAIRTINLRPQLSNIAENKVVSNLRFVSKDKMIQIQIEEAPLLPVGRLNTNYTSWVPLEDFVYLSNITKEGDFMLKTEDGYSELEKNVDYSFLTLEHKRLNLDEITASSGYVLTGVRFNFELLSEENSPFQLEIHVTPFDFVTGQLNPTDDNPSIWLTSKTQPNPPVEYTERRTEQPNDLKVRSDLAGPFTPIIMKNKFIDFRVANRYVTGQNTIPFLDARPVVVNHGLAFDGIGMMFYKSEHEHTGLVGLKVMTLDLAPHIKPQLKGSQVKYYRKLYRESLRYNPTNFN